MRNSLREIAHKINNYRYKKKTRVRWHIPIILVLGRWGQEDKKFKASLGYRVSLGYMKKTKRKKRTT